MRSTKTGSWFFLLAMGVAVSFGTLSPASTDVQAETASVPYINGLVNPAYARLPMSAREVPEKRTEKTTVFQIGTDKYAAISFGSPMFTDVNGKWLPIDQSGQREENTFVFDRLAEGVDISFDLTKPQYTLMQNGQGFTVVFSASATGRIIDDQTVEYVLADGATLTWTVNGNHVRKEILIEKYGIAQDIAFTITPIGNLHLQTANEVLSLVDDQMKEIFVFTEPFLAKEDGAKLDDVIILKKTGNQYRYIFDELILPLPYIIDPSSGPNSPGSEESVAIHSSFDAWHDHLYGDPPADALAEDGVYDQTIGLADQASFSEYLQALNFGFAIPTGATIDGILVEVKKRNQFGDAFYDNRVRIVKGGAIGSTDQSSATVWPTVAAYVSHGSSSDLWGETWTAEDINLSTFGTAISVACTDAVFGCYNDPAEIDHIRITVYYTEGGGGGDPVPALSFTSGGIAFAGYLWSRRRTKPVLHSSPS